jgi:hypothetical protein
MEKNAKNEKKTAFFDEIKTESFLKRYLSHYISIQQPFQ